MVLRAISSWISQDRYCVNCICISCHKYAGSLCSCPFSVCMTLSESPTPSGCTLVRMGSNTCALQKLPGVLSAREFVWWYNGHPEYADLPLDLSKIHSIAICGLGNVAVDCARILLQPAGRLASTDIAQHALDQLKHSSVREVHLIGRRGPVQVQHVLTQTPLYGICCCTAGAIAPLPAVTAIIVKWAKGCTEISILAD